MVLSFLFAALLPIAVQAAGATPTCRIVTAPDSPVRLESTSVLSAGGAAPLVLLYAATNTSGSAIDQFTVTVFVFDATGRLKARQVAPGRRELKLSETKYSAMVLDVGKIEPTDMLMAGVDQSQRVGSEDWWRADMRAIAEAAAAPAATPGAKK